MSCIIPFNMRCMQTVLFEFNALVKLENARGCFLIVTKHCSWKYSKWKRKKKVDLL